VESGFQVDGVLATPDACRTLTGELLRYAPADQPILVLTVRVKPTGGACNAADGRFGYSARVERVPPGRYPVEVYHQLEQTGTPGPVKVFAGEVRID
jgi:hypothetical protein